MRSCTVEAVLPSKHTESNLQTYRFYLNFTLAKKFPRRYDKNYTQKRGFYVKNAMIAIKNLSRTFGTGETAVHALKNINLEIAPGEIFGIIGLSGAGKSTLVRCVNLLERPDTGSVTVDGVEMTGLSRKELRLARRKVTMIFQSFNLLMQRTCLKNVCFPMELAGIRGEDARKRAMELLELVGLADKASAYPAQLSGGQKQRVAIARALATDPKVLLCDEATSALDPTTTASILDLLKELNRKLGVTLLVITHQMSVIEEVCQRVAILDNGEIVEQGTVEDIFTNPSTDAARRLVYPGGVGYFPAQTRVIRVAFNGGTAYQPLIASIGMDIGVKVNILGADTRNIGGKAFGTMLLGLPDDPNEAAKALSYIRSQPHISVEEAETPEILHPMSEILHPMETSKADAAEILHPMDALDAASQAETLETASRPDTSKITAEAAEIIRMEEAQSHD